MRSSTKVRSQAGDTKAVRSVHFKWTYLLLPVRVLLISRLFDWNLIFTHSYAFSHLLYYLNNIHNLLLIKRKNILEPRHCEVATNFLTKIKLLLLLEQFFPGLCKKRKEKVVRLNSLRSRTDNTNKLICRFESSKHSIPFYKLCKTNHKISKI